MKFYCITLGGTFFSGYRYIGAGRIEPQYAPMAEAQGQVAFYADEAAAAQEAKRLNKIALGHKTYGFNVEV